MALTITPEHFLFEEIKDGLESILGELKLVKAAGKEVDVQNKNLRKRLNAYSDMIGGKDDRVIFQLGKDNLERRVSGGKEHIDMDLLEETLGTDLFKKCFSKVTTSEWDEKKFTTLRTRGIITDEMLRKSMARSNVTTSLYITKNKGDDID